MPSPSRNSLASRRPAYLPLGRWSRVATLIAPCAVFAVVCGLMWFFFGWGPIRPPNFFTECVAVLGVVLIACGLLALRDRQRFLTAYVGFCRRCEKSVPLADADFAAALEDCHPEVAIRVRKSKALFIGIPQETIRPEARLNIKSWHSPFRWMFELGVDEVLPSPEVRGQVIAWFPPSGPLVSDYVRSLCIAIKEFRDGATVGNP